MVNLTKEQKQVLADAAATGTQIFTVCYDPTVETPVPPVGMFEYYREDTANLVEIIYTTTDLMP